MRPSITCDNLPLAVPASYSNINFLFYQLWFHLTILTRRVCIGGEIETEESWEKKLCLVNLYRILQEPTLKLLEIVFSCSRCLSVFSLVENPVKLRLIYIGNVTMRTRTVGPGYHGNVRSAAQPARTDKLRVSKNKLLLDCYKYNYKISRGSPDPMFAIVSI